MGDHVPEAHLGGRRLVTVFVGRHRLGGVRDILCLALFHEPERVRNRILGLGDDPLHRHAVDDNDRLVGLGRARGGQGANGQ